MRRVRVSGLYAFSERQSPDWRKEEVQQTRKQDKIYARTGKGAAHRLQPRPKIRIKLKTGKPIIEV